VRNLYLEKRQPDDPYFYELVETLEECSYDNCSHNSDACGYCPHLAKCLRWLDVIAGRLENKKMQVTEYEVYIVEFEEIRNNGDKPRRR